MIQGLKALHDKKIMHRDLKSANTDCDSFLNSKLIKDKIKEIKMNQKFNTSNKNNNDNDNGGKLLNILNSII